MSKGFLLSLGTIPKRASSLLFLESKEAMRSDLMGCKFVSLLSLLHEGGHVLFSNIPHKFPLHATLAFFLTDAAVGLEVVCQTLIAQFLPAWTILQVVQDLLVEET